MPIYVDVLIAAAVMLGCTLLGVAMVSIAKKDWAATPAALAFRAAIVTAVFGVVLFAVHHGEERDAARVREAKAAETYYGVTIGDPGDAPLGGEGANDLLVRVDGTWRRCIGQEAERRLVIICGGRELQTPEEKQ